MLHPDKLLGLLLLQFCWFTASPSISIALLPCHLVAMPAAHISRLAPCFLSNLSKSNPFIACWRTGVLWLSRHPTEESFKDRLSASHHHSFDWISVQSSKKSLAGVFGRLMGKKGTDARHRDQVGGCTVDLLLRLAWHSQGCARRGAQVRLPFCVVVPVLACTLHSQSRLH